MISSWSLHPKAGPVEPAIMLAEFVRTYRMPLIVLPKNHPGSRRFSYLVSVWPEIHTSCSIQRGTHPEQHLICSSGELAGLILKGLPAAVEYFRYFREYYSSVCKIPDINRIFLNFRDKLPFFLTGGHPFDRK